MSEKCGSSIPRLPLSARPTVRRAIGDEHVVGVGEMRILIGIRGKDATRCLDGGPTVRGHPVMLPGGSIHTRLLVVANPTACKLTETVKRRSKEEENGWTFYFTATYYCPGLKDWAENKRQSRSERTIGNLFLFFKLFPIPLIKRLPFNFLFHFYSVQRIKSLFLKLLILSTF